MLLDKMNFIWSRNPSEAYENPYEYEAQEQFLREAKGLCNQIFDHLMKKNRSFSRDDTSVNKAVWMLHVDACDTLRDCVELLVEKKHRPAGKLFRDVIETVDCARFFLSSTPKSEKALKNWYEDISPKHKEIRDWMGAKKSELLNQLGVEYNQMSKFTHRTYRVLAYNYILSANDKLAYEGEYSTSALPHAIALCCALLANYIMLFTNSLTICGLANVKEMMAFWEAAIEKRPIQKRIHTNKDIYLAHLESNDEGKV
jgi:hypothetical protein